MLYTLDRAKHTTNVNAKSHFHRPGIPFSTFSNPFVYLCPLLDSQTSLTLQPFIACPNFRLTQ